MEISYDFMWLASLALPFIYMSAIKIHHTETYQIDNTHSFANWQIRHIASKTSGTFHGITGTIVFDRNNLENSSVDATIDVFSLNSSHLERDARVLSNDFLNAIKFKEIYFVSSSVHATGKNSGILRGKLTLHGITRSIEFPFRVLGFGFDLRKDYHCGFEAHLTLKRSDYGISWGLDLPGSGLIGDEIQITLLIEGIKQEQDNTWE